MKRFIKSFGGNIFLKPVNVNFFLSLEICFMGVSSAQSCMFWMGEGEKLVVK